MDRNDCRFVGRIGGTIKEGKTQNGGVYMWFPLEIEARANASSTENNYHQTINVMCFKKNVIDYMKRVKARPNSPVVVFGFVSAFPDTIKGKNVIVNAINCNECYLIKTRPYDSEKDEEILY